MSDDFVGYDVDVKTNPMDYQGKYVDCCGYIRDDPDGPVMGRYPSEDFKEGWQPTPLRALRRSQRLRKPLVKNDMLNTLQVAPDSPFYKSHKRVDATKHRKLQTRMIPMSKVGIIYKRRKRQSMMKRKVTLFLKLKNSKTIQRTHYTYFNFKKPSYRK